MKTGISLYLQARASIYASLYELAVAEGYAMAQNIIPKDMHRIIIDNPSSTESLLSGEVQKQVGWFAWNGDGNKPKGMCWSTFR